MKAQLPQPPQYSQPVTSEMVYAGLQTVIDPELHIDIVSLGLIYEVVVTQKTDEAGKDYPFVRILMTLTTPGCPLASVFDTMVKDSLGGIAALDRKNIFVELTFDPPWTADMMSEEARAELGFD